MNKGILLLLSAFVLAACDGTGASTRGNAVLYEGSFTPLEKLRARGSFGIGATDSSHEDLVALGGTFWRTRVDGTVTELGPRDTTRHAMVTFFRAERSLHFKGPLRQEELEKKLDGELDPEKSVYAIRIRGTFAHVEAGHREHARTFGTLVGFRFPEAVAREGGYHLHYLSDDRKAGGHAQAYDAEDVEVSIQELRGSVRSRDWDPRNGQPEMGSAIEQASFSQ